MPISSKLISQCVSFIEANVVIPKERDKIPKSVNQITKQNQIIQKNVISMPILSNLTLEPWLGH